MKYPTVNDVKKLGNIVRVMSAFIFLCALIAIAGLVYATITEPFHPFIFIGFPMFALMLHVSGSIVITGYAPKYLLFTHGEKEKIN